MPLKIIMRPGRENWYLRGTVAGNRIYHSTGTSDKRAAEAIRIRTEAQALERGTYGKKATATFAEAALSYIESGGETRFLEPVLRHFGPTTLLSEIDNEAINAAARRIYPTAAPSTVNRQLITPISAILTMAAEDGLCDFRKFRRRKVTAQKMRWLTPAEWDALESHLAPHLKPLCLFLIGSGARCRESLTLPASNIFLTSGQARLQDTKNGHERMVDFPERTRAALIAAGIAPGGGNAFKTNKGNNYRLLENAGGAIKTGFNNARDKAGLASDGPDKVTPHTLRRTWATWHYAQTRDFGKLLDLGGWSKADVANIYRKAAPDDLAQQLLDHGWDFRRTGRIDDRQPVHLQVVK
jgi:integrase